MLFVHCGFKEYLMCVRVGWRNTRGVPGDAFAYFEAIATVSSDDEDVFWLPCTLESKNHSSNGRITVFKASFAVSHLATVGVSGRMTMIVLLFQSAHSAAFFWVL